MGLVIICKLQNDSRRDVTLTAIQKTFNFLFFLNHLVAHRLRLKSDAFMLQLRGEKRRVENSSRR